MNVALSSRSARSLLAGLVPASLLAALTVSVAAGPGGGTAPAGPLPTASGDFAAGSDIALRFDDGSATAVLENTAAARQFATMLPLQLTLHDPMGQAKSGRLPEAIDADGAERVLDLEVAGIYYWPPSGDIAVLYEDLGQSVPPPGAVRLGSVLSGLDALESAGNRFSVTIDAG
jgi:hypothetical protein